MPSPSHYLFVSLFASEWHSSTSIRKLPDLFFKCRVSILKFLFFKKTRIFHSVSAWCKLPYYFICEKKNRWLQKIAPNWTELYKMEQQHVKCRLSVITSSLSLPHVFGGTLLYGYFSSILSHLRQFAFHDLPTNVQVITCPSISQLWSLSR